jgi:homoserine kinase type II
VPLPLDTVAGVSYVEQGGHLWELSPWISGEADYCRESTGEKLVSAAQSLASFHRAASTFAPSLRSPAPAPGLERRLRQLLGLQQGGVQRLRQSIRRDRWPELYDRAVTMLDLFEALADSVAATLRPACRLAVPLQPCIHDIWHDHVLYEGSRVSGFVDFGAMDFDSVAGDIARLFGSLVGDIATGWETAMSAYESERPLSADERALVGVFDRSAVLLSGMNWFWWIYVDRREFQARDTIIGRLDVTIERLRNLSQKAK